MCGNKAVAVGVLLAGVPRRLRGATRRPARKPTQAFLNSVYSNAPDISSYRSSRQLVSLGPGGVRRPRVRGLGAGSGRPGPAHRGERLAASR